MNNDITSRLVAEFTLAGNPQSKFHTAHGPRPGYDPAKREAAEARIALAFLEAGGKLTDSPDVAFKLEAVFRQSTHQRRDVDNMVKLVCDGLNGVAWPDDAQVLELHARKEFVDRDSAETVVRVYTIGDMGRRTEECLQCGTTFATYPSWSNPERRKVYCSRDCAYAGSRAARTHTCEQCGIQFVSRDKKARKFCTVTCKSKSGRVSVPCAVCGTEFEQFKSWVVRRPCCSPGCSAERMLLTRKERSSKYLPGTCLACGAGTTRKEYKRCRPCKERNVSV